MNVLFWYALYSCNCVANVLFISILYRIGLLICVGDHPCSTVSPNFTTFGLLNCIYSVIYAGYDKLHGFGPLMDNPAHTHNPIAIPKYKHDNKTYNRYIFVFVWFANII